MHLVDEQLRDNLLLGGERLSWSRVSSVLRTPLGLETSAPLAVCEGTRSVRVLRITHSRQLE